MNTWRTRSSGSSSSSSASSIIAPHRRSRRGPARSRPPPHGQDLRGLLVGHAHAVGVLELLHERVQVERVGLEVLLEAGALADRLGSTSSSSARWARIRASTCSRVRDCARRGQASGRRRGHGRALCSAPARLLERALRSAPTMSSRAPRSRAQDRLREAGAREAPVRHDAEAAQPEQVGAAAGLGVDLVAEAAAAPRAAARRRASRAREDIAASRTAPSIVCETPSISFSAMLPVKPSVTITSARAGRRRRRPRRCRRTRTPRCPRSRARASSACASTHQRAAARRLLAVGQQPDARARAPRARVRASAAPMNANCTRCSRRASAFAPTSSSVTGRWGTGSGIASAGR